jgi:hypothetical protein
VGRGSEGVGDSNEVEESSSSRVGRKDDAHVEGGVVFPQDDACMLKSRAVSNDVFPRFDASVAAWAVGAIVGPGAVQFRVFAEPAVPNEDLDESRYLVSFQGVNIGGHPWVAFAIET